MVDTVRLFISSPGDLQTSTSDPGKTPEPGARERVALVAKKFNGIFANRVIIKPVLWEEQYYSAHDTFQGQIEEAGACDVVIAIFKARLGSPLPVNFPRHLPGGAAYPSGSAYEVLSAIEARKVRGDVPDIYVFRYSEAPNIKLDDPQRPEIELQWQRLNNFFDTWFRTPAGEFTLAFQNYGSDDELIGKVEDCLLQWLAKRHILPQGPVWDRKVLGSPFPGLAAFDAGREQVFFGRDVAIRQAIGRLREAWSRAAPFMLLIGASGSGKSSLLRAGLLPQITLPGTIPEIEVWCQAIIIPGSDPFAALAAALLNEPKLGAELQKGVFKTEDILCRQLKSDPLLALAPLRDALGRTANNKPARLMLGIDQAERLFSETSNETAIAFAALIARLISDQLGFVVMVLRSDAYAQFQSIEPLLALREVGASFDLVAPSEAELEDIVRRPLASCIPPLSFETLNGQSLAARLVADTKGGDALPLLQMTLSRLYDSANERGDDVMRFADYHGMDAAVSDTANDAMGTLNDTSRVELPALVTTLVRDVITDPWSGAQMAVAGNFVRERFTTANTARAALVDAFINRRLLTAEGPVIRPTHEALLRIWPAAKAIVDETASLIRLRAALEFRVTEWQAATGVEKNRHLDIPPSLLAGAQRLVALLPSDVSSDMLAFINQANAAARTKHNAKLRLAWGVATIGFAGAAIGITLFIWANIETSKAQANLQLANATLSSFAQIISGFDNPDADSSTQAVNIDTNIESVAKLYAASPVDAAALYLAAAQMRQLSPDTGTSYANKALSMLNALHLANPNDPKITLDYDRALVERARAEAGAGNTSAVAATSDLKTSIGSMQSILDNTADQATRRQIMLLLGHADEDLGDLILRGSVGNSDLAKQTLEIRSADQDYTAAAAIFQRFSSENHGDLQGVAEQAWATNKTGDIASELHDIASATKQYSTAAALLQSLGEHLQDNPIWPQHLAIIDMNLGIIKTSEMDYTAALQIFEEADNKFSTLRDQAVSQNVDLQSDAAWSRDYIGFVNFLCAEQGNTSCLTSAIATLNEARNARARLHAITPGQLQLADDLTHTNATLAAAQGLQALSERHPTDAVKGFAQAVSLTLQILREGNWEYWRLADFYDQEGEAEVLQNNYQAAQDDFAKAAATLAGLVCAAHVTNCPPPMPISLNLSARISTDLAHVIGSVKQK